MLAELGVEQVFHKIALRPGKPLWFGVKQFGDRQVLVFGLPGNPVSSLVCFELFVRPAIAALAGRGFVGAVTCHGHARARLQLQRRPRLLPAGRNKSAAFAAIKSAADATALPTVEILPWHGSADLVDAGPGQRPGAAGHRAGPARRGCDGRGHVPLIAVRKRLDFHGKSACDRRDPARRLERTKWLTI